MRELTVGEVRALKEGAEVIAYYCKDDRPTDVRIANEKYRLKWRGGPARRLEITFENVRDALDVLDVEISEVYRDDDRGVSLAGRGTLRLYQETSLQTWREKAPKKL